MEIQEVTIDIPYMLEELQKSIDHWDAIARYHGDEWKYAEGRRDALVFIRDYIKRNGYAKL